MKKDGDAVAYYRVSDEKQDLESQKSVVKSTFPNYEIIREFEDFAISGKESDRVGFNDLLKYLKSHKNTTVLVAEQSRLMRNLRLYLDLHETCNETGTVLYAADNPGSNLASSLPYDLLKNRIGAVIDEFELAKITQRMMRGKAHKIKTLDVPIVGRAPYGYTYNKATDDSPPKVTINPKEAEVVKTIFDLYIRKDMSLRGVAIELTKRNIPTQSTRLYAERRKKNPDKVYKQIPTNIWQRSSVHGVLTNPVSIGELKYGKNKGSTLTHTFKVKPIITPKLWERAQKKIQKNIQFNPRNQVHKYMLNRLIWCDMCGKKYSSYAVGGKKRYYRCTSRDGYDREGNSLACKNRAVNADVLEAYVWDFLQNPAIKTVLVGFKDKYFGEKSVKSESDEWNKRREEIIKRLDVLEKAKMKVMRDKYTDAISNKEYQTLSNGFDKEIEKLNVDLKDVDKNIKALNNKVTAKGAINELKESLERIKNKKLSFDEKTDIVRQYISKVVVLKEPNRFAIYFTFSKKPVKFKTGKHSPKGFNH